MLGAGGTAAACAALDACVAALDTFAHRVYNADTDASLGHPPRAPGAEKETGAVVLRPGAQRIIGQSERRSDGHSRVSLR